MTAWCKNLAIMRKTNKSELTVPLLPDILECPCIHDLPEIPKRGNKEQMSHFLLNSNIK